MSFQISDLKNQPVLVADNIFQNSIKKIRSVLSKPIEQKTLFLLEDYKKEKPYYNISSWIDHNGKMHSVSWAYKRGDQPFGGAIYDDRKLAVRSAKAGEIISRLLYIQDKLRNNFPEGNPKLIRQNQDATYIMTQIIAPLAQAYEVEGYTIDPKQKQKIVSLLRKAGEEVNKYFRNNKIDLSNLAP